MPGHPDLIIKMKSFIIFLKKKNQLFKLSVDIELYPNLAIIFLFLKFVDTFLE